jgi:hypothetical protein
MCRFCGEGDAWIKTVRTLSGDVVRCCDPCYGSLRKVLTIVPGPVVVWGRCQGCSSWRNLYDVRLGGLMELTQDYILTTPRGGRCRVRIYQGGIYPGDKDELPVVICTELPDNEGMSITNAAEQIAAEVLANHPDMFAMGLGPILSEAVEAEPDKPCIWIEHYEDGARGTPSDPRGTPSDPVTFDLVEFSSYRVRDTRRAGEWRREIGQPSWSPLDRATVESLVGSPVD